MGRAGAGGQGRYRVPRRIDFAADRLGGPDRKKQPDEQGLRHHGQLPAPRRLGQGGKPVLCLQRHIDHQPGLPCQRHQRIGSQAPFNLPAGQGTDALQAYPQRHKVPFGVCFRLLHVAVFWLSDRNGHRVDRHCITGALPRREGHGRRRPRRPLDCIRKELRGGRYRADWQRKGGCPGDRRALDKAADDGQQSHDHKQSFHRYHCQ